MENGGLKAVCVGDAASSRLRIAKNVPVLRVNYVPVEDVLPGVREGACSGWHKIKLAQDKKLDKFAGTLIFSGPKSSKEIKTCFGQSS
jgi:hypothetical protein